MIGNGRSRWAVLVALLPALAAAAWADRDWADPDSANPDWANPDWANPERTGAAQSQTPVPQWSRPYDAPPAWREGPGPTRPAAGDGAGARGSGYRPIAPPPDPARPGGYRFRPRNDVEGPGGGREAARGMDPQGTAGYRFREGRGEPRWGPHRGSGGYRYRPLTEQEIGGQGAREAWPLGDAPAPGAGYPDGSYPGAFYPEAPALDPTDRSNPWGPANPYPNHREQERGGRIR